jgi:dihydrofolate reductase
MFARYDTLLMGRKTYEAAAAMGGGGGGMFGGMKILVASGTLKSKEHPKVEILSGDLKASVNALKAMPGKDIWLFGGGQLFRACLDLGLVDDVETAVIPVLLGEGLPLLPAPAAKARLRLASHRIYEKTGIVFLTYEVGTTPARKTRKDGSKRS